MKHPINRIFSALLAFLLCVGLFAFPASAAEGTCGDDLTWVLENGTLTISGKGEMYNYTEDSMAPWYESADLIQCIVVDDGITSVGDLAFYGLSNLNVVSLPSTVRTLGDLAFADCIKLVHIAISGVEEIGWGCFYGCSSLVNLILPDGLRSIGDQAFYFCISLAGITVPESTVEFGAMVFTYCENLVYVKIKSPIKVLPYWTFYGCERLKELYLPGSIAKVEKDALGECPDLYYVDYSGSAEVKAEIEYQLAQETIREKDPAYRTDVVYSQTDGAVITTATKTQINDDEWSEDSESGTTIDATVTDSSGWEDVVDSITGSMNAGASPEVDVQVQEGTEMPEGALTDLADRDVTITINTSDNAEWQIIMEDQTPDSLKGSQDFSLEFEKNDSDKYADVIGDADSYIITLGETTLNSTVLLPLGSEAARRVATLYLVDGKELVKLSSVIVDYDGKAAFCLAGTSEGEYVIALDVQDIPKDEVLIPEKLAGEYDITYGSTLTDAYGNQYVLTGRVNKLGISLGTLTWIIVGILLGSVVLVGVVMVIWNKQQKKAYAMRRRPGSGKQ